MRRDLLCFVTIYLAAERVVSAVNNGLGQVPPMGWNSWNKFQCDVNETLIKKTADRIIELGLDRLGYKYVNVDDCWQLEQRAENGSIQVDPVAFPSGMKHLADYVHSKGLKFGLYSSAGTMTCCGRAGSLDYEEIDAKTYAAWGVDYLKYDNCYSQNVSDPIRYEAMGTALNKTGRPIFYSICNWGYGKTATWAPALGNSWRTTGDILPRSFKSLLYNINENMKSRGVSGPGGFNDPDMLEIGNGGLTPEEELTHMVLWAISKAPLLTGCDLDKISDSSLKILKMTNMIAINQDPKSSQAKCIKDCMTGLPVIRTPLEVVRRYQTASIKTEGIPPSIWLTSLHGDPVVAVINWDDRPIDDYELSLDELPFGPQSYRVYDLLSEQPGGQVLVGSLKPAPDKTNTMTFDLAPHGCKVYRLQPVGQDAFLI